MRMPPKARCGVGPRRANQSCVTQAHQGEEAMKLVIAVIKPFKLDEVREAQTPIGIHGET
jgi:hypothetical protein